MAADSDAVFEACSCEARAEDSYLFRVAVDGRLLPRSFACTTVPEGLRLDIEGLPPLILAAPSQPVPVLGGVVSGSCVAACAWLLERFSAESMLRARLVELGAGRGLLGMTLAAAWPGAKARLTDLEQEVCAALRRSVAASQELGAGLDVEVADLDWDDGVTTALEQVSAGDGGPRLLLGADLLWADDAVDSLFEATEEAIPEGWEFVYGSSERPSNAAFAKRMAQTPGTRFARLPCEVWRVCTCCDGWRSRERCSVTSWCLAAD
eukprot:TRINITY_DN24663_c0_g1_i1.p1 TRINITY_DN24663_c0_g1~~TRINITY_DN24663_c0_g1_i1.p1  ORF type:complete len:283 (-),score=57.32 TRINITY_DN24663_c0_g1_i1:397-1191(-)